ncbi:MAG: ribosome assembly cofactor RimP [Muribaculaceae bacterium]|nr:ribosome assembly cofactor RimP [Muribaculaceae bacterium]
MIDANELYKYVESCLEGTDLFLVEVKVGAGNLIEVTVDSDAPVSIDECERLTREIEKAYNRDEEDYTLEVGSAGLTSPLKTPRQYRKYIGQEVEVISRDGKKLSGLLKSADEEGFVLLVKEKVKREGEKRPVIEEREHPMKYEEVKQTKYILKF